MVEISRLAATGEGYEFLQNSYPGELLLDLHGGSQEDTAHKAVFIWQNDK